MSDRSKKGAFVVSFGMRRFNIRDTRDNNQKPLDQRQHTRLVNVSRVDCHNGEKNGQTIPIPTQFTIVVHARQ